MIAALLSLLGSSAVGSIIGGLFGWLNRKNDNDLKRMDHAQEAARWAHDLQVKDKDLAYMQAEAAARKDVAVIEGDSMVDAARMAALGVAHAADKTTAEEIAAAGKWGWVFVLASALNKLIRPTLTLLLTAAALWLNWVLLERLASGWPDLPAAQRTELAAQAFAWVTGQASAVIGYWFVSRGSSK
jgi:hypothetical protein